MSTIAGSPGEGAVLVLRALGLGDALTGVPALRGLRRAFPDRRLILAAPPGIGSWLRDLGVIDEVVPAGARLQPLPVADYGDDLIAVNLHGRGPQSHHRLMELSPARLIAFASPDAGFTAGPRWRTSEHEVNRWCRLVRAAGGTCERADLRLTSSVTVPSVTARNSSSIPAGAVVLHPGAAAGSRRWPLDRWIQLAEQLLRAGHRLVLTGGSDEGQITHAIARASRAHAGVAPGMVTDTGGQLSLPGLFDLIAGARLLICGDTGVAHLATAAGARSVVLFGPSEPRHWGPIIDPELHTVIWHGVPGDTGDPHGTGTDPALEKIGVDEVLTAASQQLSRSATRAR